MSTNALPHLTNGTAQGGKGTFTLSAYAVDIEGQFALLGTGLGLTVSDFTVV